MKKDILIIHTWGLGDMILLTPVLEASYVIEPDVKFSFLIFQKPAAMPIRYAPYTKSVYYADWSLKRLILSVSILRKHKFLAVMFSSGVKSWKAGIFMLMLNTKYRIGEYRNVKFPFLNFYTKYSMGNSRTESNFHLLATVISLPKWNIAVTNKQDYNLYPQFYLQTENLVYADKYYETHFSVVDKVIGFHPGCMAKNKYRRWPKEYFVELIQEIKQQYNYQILIIAGPDELEEAHYISKTTKTLMLSHEKLDNVAAVISKLDFFINTDSGLGHIASCFGILSLTIFGPGDERQTAPFSDNSFIVRHQINCAPCVQHKTRACKVECLTNLSPEVVFHELTLHIV